MNSSIHPVIQQSKNSSILPSSNLWILKSSNLWILPSHRLVIHESSPWNRPSNSPNSSIYIVSELISQKKIQIFHSWSSSGGRSRVSTCPGAVQWNLISLSQGCGWGRGRGGQELVFFQCRKSQETCELYDALVHIRLTSLSNYTIRKFYIRYKSTNEVMMTCLIFTNEARLHFSTNKARLTA